LHGSLDKTGCEARHVRDSTVNEELFDNLLVGEYLYKPERQSDVLHKGFADNLDQEGDLRSIVCSESHRQCERYYVLQNFKLVVIGVLAWLMHNLQILVSCC